MHRSGPARGSGDGVIGRDVFIDEGVTIGDRVKIQNAALVYHGVTVEDGVFIGPGAILTNDRRPARCHVVGRSRSGRRLDGQPDQDRRGARSAPAPWSSPVATSGPTRWSAPARSSRMTWRASRWSSATRRARDSLGLRLADVHVDDILGPRLLAVVDNGTHGVELNDTVNWSGETLALIDPMAESELGVLRQPDVRAAETAIRTRRWSTRSSCRRPASGSAWVQRQLRRANWAPLTGDRRRAHRDPDQLAI